MAVSKTTKSATKKTATPAKAAAKTPAAKVTKTPSAAKSSTAKPATAAKKTSAAASSKAGRRAVPAEQRRNYIEVAAYFIAERHGFTPGRELQDWATAEAEIDRLLAAGLLNQ